MVSPLRILVAEDDEFEVLLLRRAFTKAGVEAPVTFVRDGQEALDYFQRQHGFSDERVHPMPTLLVLDLKMPRLDGFDVLKWLRQQPGLRRLLVVVLTSSSEASDVNRAYDLGANSYLRKPTDLDGLRDM